MLTKLKQIIRANWKGYFITVFFVIVGGFILSFMHEWKINSELVYYLFLYAFVGVLFLAILMLLFINLGGENEVKDQ